MAATSACDPLASGARKDKMWGLPMSLSKSFSPPEGPRKGTEGQFPIYFDKKLWLPAEEGHPLSFWPRFKPTCTCLLAHPVPSFLPILRREASDAPML